MFNKIFNEIFNTLQKTVKRDARNLIHTGMFVLLAIILTLSQPVVSNAKDVDDNIYWQAHRGGGAHDAPDNTMGAFMYTWKLGGIPEADIRTTKDGIIICLHDATLARTTNAPEIIGKTKVDALSFRQIRKWDAGVKFSEKFKGEVVPTLKEVFSKMKGHSDRQVYLDIKDVDLKRLGKMIDEYKVNKQILIASPRQSDCKTLKKITKNLRTMIWLGGSSDEIKRKFAKVVESGFAGVDQVQLHLNDKKKIYGYRYQLEFDFVKQALQISRKADIDLEVFPFKFNEASLHELLDTGIRWFATDEPKRFTETINQWRP